MAAKLSLPSFTSVPPALLPSSPFEELERTGALWGAHWVPKSIRVSQPSSPTSEQPPALPGSHPFPLRASMFLHPLPLWFQISSKPKIFFFFFIRSHWQKNWSQNKTGKKRTRWSKVKVRTRPEVSSEKATVRKSKGPSDDPANWSGRGCTSKEDEGVAAYFPLSLTLSNAKAKH